MASWQEAPDAEAVNLRLDPGLAFGTGTHPTTALCLEWLDGLAVAGELDGREVLDVGCGSGILAIAALKLGAKRATGSDIDPQALTASRDNAERNEVEEDRLTLYYPEQLSADRYPIVVANILAGPLVAQTPVFKDVTKASGLKIATDAACWVDLDNDGWTTCGADGVLNPSNLDEDCNDGNSLLNRNDSDGDGSSTCDQPVVKSSARVTSSRSEATTTTSRTATLALRYSSSAR